MDSSSSVATAAPERRKKQTNRARDGATSERLSFVNATFEMVSGKQPEDCVGWDADGTTLEIRKIGPFCEHVLPTYFSHSNLSSFVRQLNMYGFQKVEVRNGVTHAFKHESFLRDRPNLLKNLCRKVNLGKKRERDSDGEDSGGGGGGGGGTRHRADRTAELETICKRLEEENNSLMTELTRAKQQIQRLEAERAQNLTIGGRNTDAATRKVQSLFGLTPNDKILEDVGVGESFQKLDSGGSFLCLDTITDPFSSQAPGKGNSLAGLASVAHGLVPSNTFASMTSGFSTFPSVSGVPLSSHLTRMSSMGMITSSPQTRTNMMEPPPVITPPVSSSSLNKA